MYSHYADASSNTVAIEKLLEQLKLNQSKDPETLKLITEVSTCGRHYHQTFALMCHV